jgi:hypothetical protein
MSDVITLTEFYERKGFSQKDAVEKAEKQMREEREHALEIRKMEHEEKMKGILCYCSAIFLCFLMIFML